MSQPRNSLRWQPTNNGRSRKRVAEKICWRCSESFESAGLSCSGADEGNRSGRGKSRDVRGDPRLGRF